MIFEGASIPKKKVECQALIIGSGAAGAVLAKELSEAGIDVVIVVVMGEQSRQSIGYGRTA